MRLLFVTDTLASGGAERVISILSNSFSSYYDEIEIICLRQHLVFYEIDPKVKIIFLEDHATDWISKLKWLRNYIKKDDIVVAFMLRVYCVVLFSLLGLKRKIVTSERNDPKAAPFKWKIVRALLLPTTTRHVVQTREIKNYFPKFMHDRISIINNPINLKQCGDKEWEPSRISILSVARLDKQKNYPMMLAAFLKFHEKYPEFILNIWGNRPHDEQLAEIEEIIESNNASDFIKLNGRCNNVAAEYDKAYMYLLTSNYEGFSNSMMEAVCSGVPVISTKVSGANELIDNMRNGILVDINDSDQLYNAMVLMAEDIELAKNMSVEGKKARVQFDEAAICGKWAELINDLSTLD